MYYYGFIFYIDFEKVEVTEEEFKRNSTLKYNRYFPRTLHNRKKDTFGYVSPYVSSVKAPYVDEVLEAFLDEMIVHYRKMKDFIISHDGEVSVVIVYDNREDEDDDESFRGYRLSNKAIELLHEMHAEIYSDAGLAKNIIE